MAGQPPASKQMPPKKTTRKPPHSEKKKAEALLLLEANGGKIVRTAKQSGIPRSSLRRWAAGQGVNDDVKAVREAMRPELIDRLGEIAHLCLDLLPGKLPAASARDVAGVLIVAVDKKIQLLTHLSAPSNQATPTEAERAGQALELLETVEKRLKLVSK